MQRWLKLLNYPGNHFALTIPFVMGAIRSPIGRLMSSEREAFLELELLLQSIVDNVPSHQVIRLSRCDRIKQPVFALLSGMYSSGHPGIFSEIQQRNSLTLFKEFLPEGSPTVRGVAERIWPEVARPILDGRFSFRQGQYSEFKPEDITLINSAFGSDADESEG